MTVDFAVLDGSATALTRMADALDRAEADRRSLSAALGQRGLVDAMAEFTGNWDRHRGKLVEKTRDLAKKFRLAAQGRGKVS